MGDNQKTLDILIRTRGELAGAKEVEASLERDIGKAKALGNTEELKKLTPQLDSVREAIKKNGVAMEESLVEGEKENISLREKREAIRALTTSFPGLREAAIFALNPMTLALFGLGGAWELFNKRVEMAEETLGALEMPDLGGDIESAKNLAQAWDGVHQAVAAALEKYNSAEGIFNRAKTAIQDELKLTKDLLDAEKQKALADLELNKDQMGPAAYAARKNQIENAFGKKNTDAERQAEQQELARKVEEQANAAITARNKLNAANAIKLPESEEVFSAQQAALKKRVDFYRQTAEEAKKRADQLRDLQGDINAGGVSGLLRSVPGAVKFGMAYGYNMTGGEAIHMQDKQARDAEETAAAIERTIASRERLKKQRDTLRDQGTAAETKATELGLELPDDQRRLARNNAGADQANSIRAAAGQENVVAQILEKNGGDQVAALQEMERAAGLSARDVAIIGDRIAKHFDTIPDVMIRLEKRLESMNARILRVENNTNIH